MSEDYDIMQDVLLERIPIIVGLEKLHVLMDDNENFDKISKISSAYRVCRSLKDVTIEKSSWFDFCGNLRQVILFYSKALEISERIYENIKDIYHRFKFTCYKKNESGLMEVNVIKELPAWFGKASDLDDLYKLRQRKPSNSFIGDKFLYDMTGYRYYKSSAQKMLIQASMTMPDGTTLLGCLPTGEGKSIVGLMPAFYEGNKTTIIIVPTISLAIDQSQNARKFYKDRKDKPEAYYSDLHDSKKNEIISRLKIGKLPILFISPEALLNSRFNSIVLENARKGIVNRLIIDEAHIVDDWGNQFRTEFQFLSTYRRKLLKASNNRLKTVLLSATFTDHCTNLLKGLFSEEDNYIEIRGDALRPEIQYFINVNKSITQRLARLKEIIFLLPRQIIIYVIKPDDARNLEAELRNVGFSSIDTFTGDINSRTKREELLDRWNNNEIDIMIATSAFGMGVDKRDIRTVIHYCIPESINRFYQEVGRGGRDGAPSISLLLTMPSEDMKDTLYLVNGKVLTSDKFIDRWKAIKENIIDRIDGNTILVDTSIKPSYIDEDVITGKLNASWNEYIILQLYRNGFIDILDMNSDNNVSKQILIRIKDGITDDFDRLSEKIEEIRSQDLRRNRLNISEMKSLATDIQGVECIANQFYRIYKKATRSCGGCNFCRNKGHTSYSSKNYSEYYYGENLIKNHIIMGSKDNYEKYFTMKNNIILFYQDMELSSIDLHHVFDILFKMGLNLIIFNDESLYEKINFKYLDEKTYKYCNMISLNEYEDNYNDFIVAGSIGLIYGSAFSIDSNRKMYELAKKLINKKNKVIHLISEKAEIYSGINLLNNIDGVIKKLNFMEVEANDL